MNNLPREVRDGLQRWEDSLKIPDQVKDMISKLNADFHHGPLYFRTEDDGTDQPACYGEEDARAFNFPSAAKKVWKWVGETIPSKIYIDSRCGLWSLKEPAWYEKDSDWYCFEFPALCEFVLGRELWRTIRYCNWTYF